MAQGLSEAIVSYAGQSNALYAYAINGPWGSGKTHFWNTEAAPDLQLAYPTARIVYVSLNGITEIHQAGMQLVAQLLPVGKSGSSWLAATGSRLLKGMDLSKWVEASDFKALFDKTGGESQLLIICFDDLERSQVPLAEAMGFINQFVEHRDAKVIVLCNEGEIPDDSGYLRIKEKTIGFTRQFDPDRTAVGRSILARFESDPAFGAFLQDYAKVILDVFERSEYVNFRILNNATLLLQTAFHTFKSIGEQMKLEHLVALVPLAIEYQAGGVGKEDVRRLLESGAPAIIGAEYLEDTDEQSPELMLRFKYYMLSHNTYFRRSPCLANLIVNGSLSANELREEIDATRPDDSPLGISLRALTSNHLAMEQHEFEDHRDAVVAAMSRGDIDSLEMMLQVAVAFSLAKQQGIIGLADDRVKAAFDEAIAAVLENKAAKSQDMVEQLERTLVPQNTLLDWVVRRFRSQIEESIRQDQRTQLALSLERLDSLPRLFAELLADPVRECTLAETPIAPFLAAETFVDAFVRSPNAAKFQMGQCLEYRYRRSSPVIEADQDWLKDVARLLSQSRRKHPEGTIAGHLTEKAAALAERHVRSGPGLDDPAK